MGPARMVPWVREARLGSQHTRAGSTGLASCCRNGGGSSWHGLRPWGQAGWSGVAVPRAGSHSIENSSLVGPEVACVVLALPLEGSGASGDLTRVISLTPATALWGVGFYFYHLKTRKLRPWEERPDRTGQSGVAVCSPAATCVEPALQVAFVLWCPPSPVPTIGLGGLSALNLNQGWDPTDSRDGGAEAWTQTGRAWLARSPGDQGSARGQPADRLGAVGPEVTAPFLVGLLLRAVAEASRPEEGRTDQALLPGPWGGPRTGQAVSPCRCPACHTGRSPHRPSWVGDGVPGRKLFRAPQKKQLFARLGLGGEGTSAQLPLQLGLCPLGGPVPLQGLAGWSPSRPHPALFSGLRWLSCLRGLQGPWGGEEGSPPPGLEWPLGRVWAETQQRGWEGPWA